MSNAEKLKFIFNHPNLFFLSFNAGFGGEWLLNQIHKNSYFFLDSTPAGNTENFSINRYTAHRYNLIQNFLYINTASMNDNEIIDKIVDDYKDLNTFLNFNLADDLNVLISDLNYPIIAQIHLCDNIFFNTKKNYLISCRSLSTLKRYETLRNIKISNTVIPQKHILNVLCRAFIKCKALRKPLTRHANAINVLKQQINLLPRYRSALVVDAISGDLDFRMINLELLLSSNADLLKKISPKEVYSEITESYLNAVFNNLKELEHKRTVIYIEDFKIPGYLQEIFMLKKDISTDFIEWDKRNDTLLELYHGQY